MTLLLVDCVRIGVLLVVFLDSKHYVGRDFDWLDHYGVLKDVKMLWLFTVFFF